MEWLTPRTAFPLGMLVSRKSFRSSLTMPSLTELMLDKASPAVLKGKNPIKLTTFKHEIKAIVKILLNVVKRATVFRKQCFSLSSRLCPVFLLFIIRQSIATGFPLGFPSAFSSGKIKWKHYRWKLGDIADGLLHLWEKSRHLLKLANPEQKNQLNHFSWQKYQAIQLHSRQLQVVSHQHKLKWILKQQDVWNLEST